MKKLWVLLFTILTISLTTNVYAENESEEELYIVTYKDIESKNEINLEFDVKQNLVEDFEFLPIKILSLSNDELKILKENKKVLSVEKNLKIATMDSGIKKPTTISIDDNFWGKNIVKNNFSTNGEGVNVAVMDTGTLDHSDFDRNGFSVLKEQMNCYTGFFSFDDTDASNCTKENAVIRHHGTHVAGIIASKNFGVTPAVNLYSIRVVEDTDAEWVWADDFVRGANLILSTYSDEQLGNEVDVVNMSFSIFNVTLTSINHSLSAMYDKGVSLVTTSGNKGDVNPLIDNMDQTLGKHPDTIAVGALTVTDERLERAEFSSTGPKVELSAPGDAIASTIGIQGTYAKMDGTSQAAPYVTAAIAILKQQFPDKESVGATTQREYNDKIREMLRENAIPMNGKSGEETNPYGDWEFGAGLVQAIPYGIKGSLDLTSSMYDAYSRPDTDSPLGRTIGNGKFDYYQEWNDWYKVDDGSGNKVWIKHDETVENEPKEPIFWTLANSSYPYIDPTTGEMYMGSINWSQESFYKPLNYQDIVKNFDYYPNKKSYETLQSMQNGDFYDSDSLKSEREELFSLNGRTLEEDGSHPLKNTVSSERLDSMNQYNLAFENAMGQRYFVPIWTMSVLDIDIEEQSIKPVKTNYIHPDGYNGSYSEIYGLTEEHTIRSFSHFGNSVSLRIKSTALSVPEIHDYNFLSDIEARFGTKLRLVQVITDEINFPEKPIAKPAEPIFWSLPNTVYPYVDSKTGNAYYTRVNWSQESFYKPLNYQDIVKKFDYYPNEKAYETLRSMQSGAFYDSELLKPEREELFKYHRRELAENGEHPLKDTVSSQRLDSMNQYNLAFENAMGQRYFVPIWTMSVLDINIEEQTIKPVKTDYIHPDGYNASISEIYGLNENHTYGSFSHLGNSGSLQIKIIGLKVPEIHEYNFLPDIERYLGETELRLISY